MDEKPEISKSKFPRSELFALIFFVPLLYLLLNAVTENQYIAVIQLAVFAVPVLVLNRRHRCLNWLGGSGQDAARGRIFKFSVMAFATALITLGLTFLLNQALMIWQQHIPLPEDYTKNFDKLFHLHQPYGVFIDVVQLSLIPAFGEELFFRGFALNALRGHFSKLAAVFLSALLFSVYHINPALFPFYFVLGILFALIQIRTRSVGLAIIAHFTNNAYGVWLYHQMNAPI